MLYFSAEEEGRWRGVNIKTLGQSAMRVPGWWTTLVFCPRQQWRFVPGVAGGGVAGGGVAIRPSSSATGTIPTNTTTLDSSTLFIRRGVDLLLVFYTEGATVGHVVWVDWLKDDWFLRLDYGVYAYVHTRGSLKERSGWGAEPHDGNRSDIPTGSSWQVVLTPHGSAAPPAPSTVLNSSLDTWDFRHLL